MRATPAATTPREPHSQPGRGSVFPLALALTLLVEAGEFADGGPRRATPVDAARALLGGGSGRSHRDIATA